MHKHRNRPAHAPKKLYDEVSADYADMIYANTPQEVEAKRKAFLRKWRLRCRPVADSLEEAGEKLLAFLRFPSGQWKSIRTANAIERLHEEFERRIKTQCMLPCAQTACMLFWALLARGQITLRKVDGWNTLHVAPAEHLLDPAARTANLTTGDDRHRQFPPSSRRDPTLSVPPLSGDMSLDVPLSPSGSTIQTRCSQMPINPALRSRSRTRCQAFLRASSLSPSTNPPFWQ